MTASKQEAPLLPPAGVVATSGRSLPSPCLQSAGHTRPLQPRTPVPTEGAGPGSPAGRP